MKKIKYLLILLISFLSFQSICLADSSNFQSVLSMEPDITENQVNVVLGFSGEEVMIVKHKFAYDNTKLKLVEIKALDNFNLTVSKETVDGKYSIVSVLADSDYSFDNSNYAVAVFQLKDKFKIKKEGDVFLYNFEGIGPGEVKYRNNGQIMTLKRDSISYMSSVLNMITSSTKTEYWLRGHYYIFIIAGLVIVALIVLILKMPSKRKEEKREQAVADQLRSENYDANKNFKIDNSVLEEIGKQEKNVDMTQAILVNENVKPFGESESRFDETQNAESLGGVVNPSEMMIHANPVNNAPANNGYGFVQMPSETPVAQAAPVAPAEPQINAFNMTLSDQNTEVTPLGVDNQLEQSGIVDVNENLTQINTQAIEAAPTVDVNPNPTFDVNPITNVNPEPVVEAPIVVQELPMNDNARPQHFAPMENVPVVEPRVEAPVEMPQVAVNQTPVQPVEIPQPVVNQAPVQPVEIPMPNQNNNNNTPSGGIMNILLILGIACSFMFMGSVSAQKYDVPGLRTCLTYNNCSVKNYDYNFDGVVDILDLLSTKDTNNCNFEKLMKTDPGFKEVHDGNTNIMSESQLKNTTTTKAGRFTRKTTSKKTTTIKGTKTTTAKKTTTKGATTAKATTTKKATTKKETTTRTTTTRTTKTTTVKTTTATPEYTITVNINGGESKTLTIKKGGYGVVDTTKPEGMGSVEISCANKAVTVTKNTSLNKFTFKSPTGNDTCTIKYLPKASYKVTVLVKFSPTKSTTKYVTVPYQGSGNVTFSLSATYNTESISCDPQISSSFSNGVFSVNNVTKDSKCVVTLSKVE